MFLSLQQAYKLGYLALKTLDEIPVIYGGI